MLNPFIMKQSSSISELLCIVTFNSSSSKDHPWLYATYYLVAVINASGYIIPPNHTPFF